MILNSSGTFCPAKFFVNQPRNTPRGQKFNSLNVSGITTLNNTTSINSSLNVSGILNIYSNTINNYLFNNTGSNHSTYQNFNNIDKLGYMIETIRAEFPDAVLVKDGEKINCEFEHLSSNYLQHGHPQDGTCICICWRKDIEIKGVETFSLEEYLRGNNWFKG